MSIDSISDSTSDSTADSAADDAESCCAEFASARRITFAYPDSDDGTWLLYGTDFLSVSGGDPALRYWPIHFCPFCGARLTPARPL